MTVAVAGASGFIGNAVVSMLRAHGHRVVALGRNPGSMMFPHEVERRRFDPNDAEPNPAAFEGADAVVNLSGESIAGRWNAKKKAAIAASRIDGTDRLVAGIAACAKKPQVLVSASAVGYYGDRGDERLLEDSAPGNDFLAGVCARWEASAKKAATLGVRVVAMRFGVVLGDGGALEKMKLPFALGLGGPMGSGRQFLPWIHLDDLASLCRFVLESSQISGAVNVAAPDETTNARLAHALGAALHRPAFVPAPSFALRAVLGEFADTLLASQRVIPAVARDAGFQWTYPQLEPALRALVR